MDSLITAAARALAAGDPLGALKRVALRDDAPALALRGIAMAQLGDLVRAKDLLRKAARAFGRVAASLRAAGRKPTARAYDALIAATALAENVPLYTCNPGDFDGIEGLEVRPVPHPDS